MPFKTILAIVQGPDDAQHVIECATALATRFEAHLIGLHSEALPVPYSSTIGFPEAEFIQASSEFNTERSLKLEKIFLEHTAAAGISTEWQSLESFSGDSAHSGVISARTADLVVAAQIDRGAGTGDMPDLDALLYDAGRPVLVTPQGGPSVSSFRKVLISWNGSREAARATFDALPFIIDADSAEILVVDPPEDADAEEAGASIAAALARHGAKVSVHTESSSGSSIDTVIRNRVSETGADLLVMGAYSHSWLRQLLFGGVTRTVLQSMPVTSFLSR